MGKIMNWLKRCLWRLLPGPAKDEPRGVGLGCGVVDPNKAANIVQEAITQVTSLRGRLGAFQSASLETNKNTLNDTLVNLTKAQSSIRDADFASESAALTAAAASRIPAPYFSFGPFDFADFSRT